MEKRHPRDSGEEHTAVPGVPGVPGRANRKDRARETANCQPLLSQSWSLGPLWNSRGGGGSERGGGGGRGGRRRDCLDIAKRQAITLDSIATPASAHTSGNAPLFCPLGRGPHPTLTFRQKGHRGGAGVRVHRRQRSTLLLRAKLAEESGRSPARQCWKSPLPFLHLSTGPPGRPQGQQHFWFTPHPTVNTKKYFLLGVRLG